MSDSIGALPSSASADVIAALRSASRATGVDFGYLVRTAQRESNFDATARASTSSAAGLFQFTNDTWLSVVDRYGSRHGLDTAGMSRDQILALRQDPHVSARMGAELAAENARLLAPRIGRNPTGPELYIAHFLGPNDAVRLIQAAEAGAPGPAADLFPQAARANASVFRDGAGQPLTASGLHAKLTSMIAPLPDAMGNTPSHAPQGDEAVRLQAQLGVAQLTTSLMTALFGLQEEDRR